ncbi:N4-gp56 family major capsid protein [Phascolarctobacterium faecium]|jgi:N4-gp56 family major capsid protein|uniref:N4-gp56 family major capsid protein n=1 Tax=Phascolarctobacterium faecium TaxID=33025 RepID=UPI002059F195|nr:MAG TPA: major capsid protein [Caudoviricetes sp.]
MAINYAAKYSEKVDERFALASLTAPAVNNDFDFVGVQTVNVYSIPTAGMNDYSMTGTSRYGTPAELQDTVQELTLSRDRSFTFSIDRRNYNDTMMTKEAGKALARQVNEVIIPEIDTYRLATLAANAGGSATAAITNSNAYSMFLDGKNNLIENKVPAAGSVAYVSADFFKNIKLDSSFIQASDLAQNTLITGQLGMVDGTPIIPVPSTYLPENCAFIITHPVACCSPVKLADYMIHDNPPGINGWLVEGRVYYDAFVLSSKANAVYVHMIA